MNNETSFKPITAVSTVIAALLILGSTVVLSMAVNFNFDFLSAPGDLITAGLDKAAAQLFRWGSIMELIGYFLLFIPLTLYLWYWLEPRSPKWVTLYTVSGLISIVIGIIGATIRATFWPSMMVAYPQAAEAQRQALEVVFKAVTDFTFEGLYPVDLLLAGLWYLGIGLVLRSERRVLAVTTMILGLAFLGAGLGWLFQVDPLARLETIFIVQPIWLIWIALIIWRYDEQVEPALGLEGRTGITRSMELATEDADRIN